MDAANAHAALTAFPVLKKTSGTISAAITVKGTHLKKRFQNGENRISPKNVRGKARGRYVTATISAIIRVNFTALPPFSALQAR